MGAVASNPLSRDNSLDSIASYDSAASSGSGHVTPKRLNSAGQAAVMRHLRHKCQFSKECLDGLKIKFDKLTPGPSNKAHEMTRLRFSHLLAQNGFAEKDKGVLGSVFDAFDEDKTGTVSFSEMAVGLATFLVGTSKSTDELIQSVFRVYDINNDGYVSKEEMVRVLDACNTVSPIARFDASCTEAPVLTKIPSTYGRIMAYVNNVFEKVDKSWASKGLGREGGRDEQLDLEQFSKAFLLFPTIVQGVSAALRVVFRRIFVESVPGSEEERHLPTLKTSAGTRMLEVRDPSDLDDVPMFARALHDNLAAIEVDKTKKNKTPVVKRRPIASASSQS